MSEDSKKTVFRKIVVPPTEKKKYLVGNSPPYLGKPYELTKPEYTVGREEERDLYIASDMVSRLHASIVLKEDEFYIKDNESSNGTYLNNELLTPKEQYKLSHKDILKFDAFEFIFIDSAQSDLWETLKPLDRAGAQIIALYSPKGGTGVSSVAVNLAHTLNKISKKPVAVADFNLRFGDILTFSSGKIGRTIYELIQEPEITGEVIEKFLTQGVGYKYLQAPSKIEYAELVRAENVKKILWSLEAKHDFVIVDLKSEIDDISITTWEISNVIYILAHPEFGHMLALRKILDAMNKLKYPESKVRILINRVGRSGSLAASEIKETLKREILTLPDAPQEAILTTHGGQLYTSVQANAPLAGGINDLARIILGEEMAAKQSGGIFSKLMSVLGF